MGETQVDAAERIATASANFRESNGRPSRVRRLPARFEEDEVYALPQQSQPPRFVESALALHSRADYSTAEKRSASETSQKSTLPADHRAYIRASINNGWKKLNEYYDKLGESPLFAAAIILHPRFGISWLEATWVSEEQLAWVRDAKAGIKDYFTRWYDANQGLCEETTKYDAAPRTMGQEDDEYTQWINSKTKKAFATGGSVGELESRSQTRASPDDLHFESSSFDAIFRTTHPEKAKLGPSGKRKTSGRVMYECLHCPPDSPWSNGKRGNAIYHAKRKHASILQTEASTVDEHDSDSITRPSKQPRMDSFFPSRPSDTTLRRVFNRQQYIESIVGLLTRRRLPFSAVKWDEMQDIILACNPAIEDLLLTSRDAAMRHITTTFDLYRSQLKAKLQAWVDNGYRLQKALLAMPECRYSHSGERQATLMAEAIEEYGIAKQIGYHTGDNATSNDTCLKHLSQMLQDKYGISFHPNQRRIRCIAHIINLSLQAFLLASSKEALRAALAAASDVTGAEMYEQFYFTLYDVSANEPTSRSEASELQEQSFSKVWKGKARRAARKPPDFRDDKFRGWQTIPAMRKLHNIAVWLRNSSIHSDLWEDRVSLRLGIDNDTRWNSWYKLIDNLIRRQSQIKQFLLDYDKEINDNILNSSDWDYLERTYRFLHPFASATLWAEGKNSTLSQILTIMDGLLRHYEKNKEHYSKPETFDRRILHSIEMGWFILDKYYTMTEDAPVYAAALLLDPSKRIRYIERHWPESWHENAIAGVRTIWEEYKTQPETGPAESVDEVSASQKRQPNEWDALLEELEVTEDLGDSMDDLEDFIKATPIKISGSPLQWWCHKDQRKTYPQLSRMAIDILSIAPESADPESAFSGGRRTLSWDRERMTCENLEKVECIGNWLREGHIQKTVHGGMGVITDTGFDSGGGEDSDVNFD
ncbi:Zinc finger BED domain-containing protein 4 [Fusarium oxysporum f. sp. rapae]|uniref:Zinc finger BED domain-containing protein 4 n=1 Tax=Fusarium oxysporum f. sp. rapae TaxID=485398 RepID=A0A8J5TXL9_FUSOX|nr:Zinc finger BED domain-containing protein 4 [Fusarium oxysporum f. sp. rapae]